MSKSEICRRCTHPLRLHEPHRGEFRCRACGCLDRPIFYRLEGHQAVPVSAEAAFPRGRPSNARVGLTTVGEARVSTVFLAVDSQWGDGPPVLFETMIFGGPYDGHQWRYASWEAAEAGHHRVVAALRSGVAP